MFIQNTNIILSFTLSNYQLIYWDNLDSQLVWINEVLLYIQLLLEK